MTRTSALWHLQALDLERDEKLHRADLITRSLANDPKLAAAKTASDAGTHRLTQLHAEMQDTELEAKSLDGKIKEIEARMASGRITHPKELDALEKDRQMHLRHRGELDTKLLELMEAMDRAQKSSNEKDATLKKTESTHASEIERLGREREALNARVAEIAAEVAKQRAAFDPSTLAMYDRLRQAKSGRAVAQLKNNGCGVCGMQIPLGLRSRVEEDAELVFCLDCGRILAA